MTEFEKVVQELEQREPTEWEKQSDPSFLKERMRETDKKWIEEAKNGSDTSKPNQQTEQTADDYKKATNQVAKDGIGKRLNMERDHDKQRKYWVEKMKEAIKKDKEAS